VRGRALLFLAALSVLGCGTNSATSNGPRTPPPTPPPTPTPVPEPLIAAVGDIVCGGNRTGLACKHVETSEVVRDIGERHGNLAAVLPLGDLQYEFGFLPEFQAFYDPTWGRFKSISRPAIGNHEYDAGPPNGYFDYWNGRGVQDGPAGSRSTGYYSFDLGRWHLIALNSNCRFVGGCGPGSPQERWLRTDLEQHARPCTLAYWHHPRFSSGPSGNLNEYAALWQALYDHDADVILVAHDHVYERFAPQTPAGQIDARRGIRQFTVGTGGRNLYDFPSIQRNSELRYNAQFGVLFLELRPRGYGWKFVTIDDDGGHTDDGAAECH
jgi:acid phosphatase type 7